MTWWYTAALKFCLDFTRAIKTSVPLKHLPQYDPFLPLLYVHIFFLSPRSYNSYQPGLFSTVTFFTFFIDFPDCYSKKKAGMFRGRIFMILWNVVQLKIKIQIYWIEMCFMRGLYSHQMCLSIFGTIYYHFSSRNTKRFKDLAAKMWGPVAPLCHIRYIIE
mgnify:CR=1 FL=1